MVVQKVVRTYPHSYTTTTGYLQELLEQGYKVVMVNKIDICLEYIVEKEE